MRRSLIALAVGGLALGFQAKAVSATPASDGGGIAQLMNIGPVDFKPAELNASGVSVVRESALRDTATALGVQWGIGDRSREISQRLSRLAPELDRRFGFGRLTLGAGFLPPVIHETRDALAVAGNVLRIAKRTYTIEEPPRPVAVVPTWRDWLFLGLDESLKPSLPAHPALLPRDQHEIALWKRALSAAYAEGRAQAEEAFQLNLARLKSTHEGMERYYDLWKRGVVSAPVIAQVDTLVDRTDPNTLIVGGAVIRVTVPADFVETPGKWVPLAQ